MTNVSPSSGTFRAWPGTTPSKTRNARRLNSSQVQLELAAFATLMCLLFCCCHSFSSFSKLYSMKGLSCGIGVIDCFRQQCLTAPWFPTRTRGPATHVVQGCIRNHQLITKQESPARCSFPVQRSAPQNIHKAASQSCGMKAASEAVTK